MKKYQKRIRLKDFQYIGHYRYFVTICTDRKYEIFNNSEIVDLCVKILQEVANKYLFDIWVYCFMPDHLHILCEGKNENSDFRKFISIFKQRSSFAVLKNLTVLKLKCKFTKLWQENYYEHILRNDEGTIDVVRYILNNPVRRGLVENYLEYKYSGSFKLDIKNL